MRSHRAINCTLLHPESRGTIGVSDSGLCSYERAAPGVLDREYRPVLPGRRCMRRIPKNDLPPSPNSVALVYDDASSFLMAFYAADSVSLQTARAIVHDESPRSMPHKGELAKQAHGSSRSRSNVGEGGADKTLGRRVDSDDADRQDAIL
jgi:hypothetical protein